MPPHKGGIWLVWVCVWLLFFSMRKAPRVHKVTILLNDAEQRALEQYCDRYHVANRSRFIRETLVRAVLHQMDKDNPTLF